MLTCVCHDSPCPKNTNSNLGFSFVLLMKFDTKLISVYLNFKSELLVVYSQ